MREPHHYVCKDGKQHCIAWYENGKRLRKTFNDANEAEVFYQQRLLGAVDKDDLILKEVTTLRKYVAGGRLAELEAENARLTRLIQNAPSQPSDEQQIESLTSDVRLVRMDIAIKLESVPAAVVLQQLYWCLEIMGWGKILDDGQRYIFNTLEEWKDKYFQAYSVPTLKRTFARLEKKGLVLSRQPEGRASRRKYYRLTPEGINLIPSGDLRSKRSLPSDQFDPMIGSKRSLPYTERESTSNTSTRSQATSVTRSEVENELLHHIADLCGPEEMRKNGAMWRARARKEPRALRHAIEDLELRSDNYHLPALKNPGAMLTAAFERCRDQLARSLAHTRKQHE